MTSVVDESGPRLRTRALLLGRDQLTAREQRELADYEAQEAAESEREDAAKLRAREARQAQDALGAHIVAHAAELADIRAYSMTVREALEVVFRALDAFADLRDKWLPEVVQALREEMLTEVAGIRDELVARIDSKTYGALAIEPDAKVIEKVVTELRQRT